MARKATRTKRYAVLISYSGKETAPRFLLFESRRGDMVTVAFKDDEQLRDIMQRNRLYDRFVGLINKEGCWAFYKAQKGEVFEKTSREKLEEHIQYVNSVGWDATIEDGKKIEFFLENV